MVSWVLILLSGENATATHTFAAPLHLMLLSENHRTPNPSTIFFLLNRASSVTTYRQELEFKFEFIGSLNWILGLNVVLNQF